MPRLPGVNTESLTSQPLGNNLNDFLDSHRPHLSPEAFDAFTKMVMSYVDQYPSASPGAENEEIASSSYSPLVATWLERNEQLRDEGLLIIEQFREPLLTRVQEEFRASGLDELSPEFNMAADLNEEVVAEARAALADKSERYQLLLDSFSRRTDIIAEELVARMTEAVTDMSNQILSSPLMPEPPKEKLIRRKDKLRDYESWRESKARLIGRQVLPEREEILDDYYRSVDAAFRRVLFGNRQLRLDLGFNSDSTDEIDSYQRRYYDLLGGYQIALTPAQWARQYLYDAVDHLLYAPESETAQKLDEAAAQNHRFSRDYRKGRSYRGSSSSKEERADSFTRYEYEEFEPDETHPEDNLNQVQLLAFRDIQLLIDSRLPKTSRKDRAQLVKICKDIIGQLEIDFTEFAPASTKLRKNIVKKMIRKLHPDVGGDEELCKAIINLYEQLPEIEETDKA